MAPTITRTRESTPSRKSTSTRTSSKRAALGFASPSQPPPRHQLLPRLDVTDAERIEQTLCPFEFGIAQARRASMPVKYLAKDQLLTSQAGPSQPSFGEQSETIGSSSAEAGPSEARGRSPSTRVEPLPPYAPPPHATASKTDALVDLIWERLDHLVFNLPSPIFKPIEDDTLIKGGRPDLVEKHRAGDLLALVATHSKTWHASRLNLRVPPRFDPNADSVTCVVVSEQEHFVSPTHMFVVTSGSGTGMTYTYVPVHDVVYLSQCAGIRPAEFPPSNPERVVGPNGEVLITLPIIRRTIPANQVFSLLDQYLYQQNLTFFFQQLISPLFPTAQERQFESNYERCRYYVKLLMETFSFHQIGRRLLAIHHLHQVAQNLGIVEVAFWRVVNVAWFCCGAALKGKKADMERSRSGRRSASTPSRIGA